MDLSGQHDYSATASESEEGFRRGRLNQRFSVSEAERRAKVDNSRRYWSLSKHEEEAEDPNSSDGDSEADTSRPRRRLNGVLVAGIVVALLLFTLSGLALISYFSNRSTSSSASGITTSPTSAKAEAETSTPTSRGTKASTKALQPATEFEATITSSQHTYDPLPSTVASTAKSTSSATSTSSSDGDLSLLTTLGITGFLGENSGIGSWFRTDSSQDSTNGNSWCGCPYNDSVPGFAPSVGTMLGNFNGVYQDAGKAYCGLEARFTAPNGNTELLVIADGFDDKWVLAPGSVDIIWGSFIKLYGSETTDKNDVIKDLKWEFTGVQRKEYTFEVCR